MSSRPAAWMSARIVARARALWDAGVSAREIALRIGDGTTKSAIVGYAHRHGWPTRPSPIGRRRGEVRDAAARAPEKPHRAQGLPPTRRTPEKLEPPPMPSGARPEGAAAPRRADGLRPAPPPPVELPLPHHRQCQWPLSGGMPWRFCDAPTVGGTAWCEAHRALCYHRSPRQVWAP